MDTLLAWRSRVSLGLAVPKSKLSVISQKWTCGVQIYPCFQLVQPAPCKSSNGQQQMEWFLRQPAFIYVWRLPLVWVSTSHLHLNNPFAVNGCTTHNTSFVYEPPKSSLPVCSWPVHFYGDDQHNSSLQRHPNLVERVAFIHWKTKFSRVIEN